MTIQLGRITWDQNGPVVERHCSALESAQAIQFLIDEATMQVSVAIEAVAAIEDIGEPDCLWVSFFPAQALHELLQSSYDRDEWSNVARANGFIEDGDAALDILDWLKGQPPTEHLLLLARTP
jgi:hypothetical protein